MCVFVNLWERGRDISGNDVAAKTHFHGSLCFSIGSLEWQEVMRHRHPLHSMPGDDVSSPRGRPLD